MTFQRAQKSFTFADGRQVVLWEANWDSSMERSALETQAREARARLNGSGDPELLYFQETIYPSLAACTAGDVPTPEQAFGLPPAEIDAWFQAAREVNPDWFTTGDALPETVTFRDGSTITIVPANTPSVLMRLHRLESEAEKPAGEEKTTTAVFRVLYYPRLAACSVGDVPTMEEARTGWPVSELNAWYEAARRVNPALFLSLEEIALHNQAAAEEEGRKKKRPRSRS